MEALTNFNVFEAFEKVFQANVLTEIKKLLHTHILKAVANYVRPHLNTFVLDVMKNNQINLFTQSSTSTDDLSEMDLKIILINVRRRTRRKDVGEPSSRSSRQNKSPVIHAQVDTPAIQSLDQEDENVQNHPNPEWFSKKSGWNKETHRYIFEALNGIHHWEESIIDFFKAEMSTRTKGSVYLDLRIKSVVRVMVKKKWGCGFLTSIIVRRSDDKEYEFSYADLPRLSLNNVEDMYLLQVQDKLHHLLLRFMRDFNNALLLFIKRVVIQNKGEDIQLRVESYQQTLNLTVEVSNHLTNKHKKV
ncbi:hypothetical protein Tco_0316351 [Tanacetum coccineum]